MLLLTIRTDETHNNADHVILSNELKSLKNSISSHWGFMNINTNQYLWICFLVKNCWIDRPQCFKSQDQANSLSLIITFKRGENYDNKTKGAITGKCPLILLIWQWRFHYRSRAIRCWMQGEIHHTRGRYWLSAPTTDLMNQKATQQQHEYLK